MTKYAKYYRKFSAYKEILKDRIDISGLSIDNFTICPNKNEFLHKNNLNKVSDLFNLDFDDVKTIFFGKFSWFRRVCTVLKQLCDDIHPVGNIENNVQNNQMILKPLFKLLNETNDKVLEKIEIPFAFIGNTRLENAFKRYSIKTYYDLKKYGITKTLAIRNVGKKSFKDLKVFGINDVYKNISLGESIFPEKNNQTELDKFINLLSETLTTNNSNTIENGNTNKDYSLFQTKLRNLIFENAFVLLTAREYSIFVRRFNFDKKETLESISKDYNVTRERIRQICVKCLKKVGGKMSSAKYCQQYDFIKQFYSCLLVLESIDIVYYCSYSKHVSDLDWIVIQSVISKYVGKVNMIPNYKTHNDIESIEKEVKTRTKKTCYRNVEHIAKRFSLDKLNILIIQSIFSMSKVKKVTDKKLLKFMTGNIKFYESLPFYSCYQDLTLDDLSERLEELAKNKIINIGFYKGNKMLYLNFKISKQNIQEKP